MKILFFIESLRSGGKERRLVELLKGLKRTHPEIEMELGLTRKVIHYTDVLDLDIPIHVIERKGIKKDPRLFWKFYKIAKKFKPDIIHVWGNMVAIYAIPTKVLLHIPMINSQITNSHFDIEKFKLSIKISFLASDFIVANSKAGLISYKAPANKSKYIYNGFDFERVANLKEKSEIKFKYHIKSKYVVCMVASFVDAKDYRTYIDAAQIILEFRKDITFLGIGDRDRDIYEKIVTDNNKDNIKLLGKQTSIESIINICDIGVLSTYTEGISNSIMEFMALGKPVVATSGGGTKELIIDGETGFLVPQKSPRIMADKILLLINNDKLRNSMGQIGKRRIEKNFNLINMTNEYIDIYNNMVRR